jgi:hypothetical protein
MKILFSEFHPKANLTVPKGTLFVMVFVKEQFSWPKNGFIEFKRYDLVCVDCCPIHPRMEFLEQNLLPYLLN